MLSVGSGDGSQQAAIVKSGHTNIVTTFYDSRPEVLRKYPNAADGLEFLESRSTVCYEIDATKLPSYKLGTFDLIFFTFPHNGVPNSEPDNVPSNKDMLRMFLSSAPAMLNENGCIEITLKTGLPYDRWQLPALLEDSFASIKLLATETLDKSVFPGYVHRLTNGTQGVLAEVKDVGAKVYTFGVPGSEAVTPPAVLGMCINVIGVPWMTLTDDEVATGALWILASGSSSPLTVLDIRNRFDSALRPDTRQLNRVLYAHARSGLLRKIEPSKLISSDKPTWLLASNSPPSQETAPGRHGAVVPVDPTAKSANGSAVRPTPATTGSRTVTVARCNLKGAKVEAVPGKGKGGDAGEARAKLKATVTTKGVGKLGKPRKLGVPLNAER